MSSIFAPNWLSRALLEQSLRRFASRLPDGSIVLDVGCGHKPYAYLFARTRYTGIDHDPTSKADFFVSSTDIPLPAAYADAIICTQTLQHTLDVAGTIKEIARLLKPGGRLFVSVPFATKIVAEPQGDDRPDYWRFTEYGLRQLLSQHGFEIQAITPFTGYGGTIAGALNYFFASLNIPFVFTPLYLINNLLGLTVDSIAAALPRLLPFSKMVAWYRHIYQSFTLGYITQARRLG